MRVHVGNAGVSEQVCRAMRNICLLYLETGKQIRAFAGLLFSIDRMDAHSLRAQKSALHWTCRLVISAA